MNSEHDPDEIDATEAALLADLAGALGHEPVPDDVIARAEGLVAWFDVDDELVALLQTADDELVGTRGGAAPTAMRFATPDGATEVEFDLERDRIVGHVVIGDATSVVAERSDSTRSSAADVDELGRFEIGATRPGAHRLRLLDAEGTTVTTDWFVIEQNDDDERTT